jgi:hypothetical protein
MTTRAFVRALAVASIVGAGCSDPAEPPLPAFSVGPATQWSGGTITIRSSYFANRAQAPIIVVGADTLAVSLIDDSTASTVLPRGASGPVLFELARGNARDSLGTVQRMGHRGTRQLYPGLSGELLVIDSADHPILFGSSSTTLIQYAPLGRVDLVTGAMTTLRSVHSTSTVIYGLSPSVAPGTIVARDTADTLRIYDMRVSPPQPLSRTLFASGYVRHLTLLKDSLWLYTQSHWTYTHAVGDTTPFRAQVQTESPWSLFVSPRGDRTTMTVNVGIGGVPVFDNATGETAYTLPLAGTEAIAFTPDGSVLYAVGGYYFKPDTIVAVNAATGLSLHPKVTLPEGFIAFSAAYSTRAGGVLLIGGANTTTLALLVYDATTLELRGVLPTPDSCGSDPMVGNCWYGVVATDDGRSLAYLAIPGSPTPVWSFDLVSTP